MFFFAKWQIYEENHALNQKKDRFSLAKQGATSYIRAHEDEICNPFQPLVVGLYEIESGFADFIKCLQKAFGLHRRPLFFALNFKPKPRTYYDYF